MAALPFESPELAVTAVINDGGLGFAARKGDREIGCCAEVD